VHTSGRFIAMKKDELVSFGPNAAFDVLHGELARNVGGALEVEIRLFGDTKVNHRCLADTQNRDCVVLNDTYHGNSVCFEADVGPV
jgi:hypothetical protein